MPPMNPFQKKISLFPLIEVFKILNGYENIDSNIFFVIKESKITRGHNYTLVKKQSRWDVRKYSFSQIFTMYGITYQLIVYMLVVLINYVQEQNRQVSS